jgi:hypothetical protein
MLRWTIGALLAGALLASPAAAAGPKQIYKVDGAAASIHDNKLMIIATGAVVTGGWSKPRLRLKPGHKPENNTLEFEFLALPPGPNDAVIQSLVPVTATLATRLPPYGVTQIRIEAQTNSAVAEIKP